MVTVENVGRGKWLGELLNLEELRCSADAAVVDAVQLIRGRGARQQVVEFR